MAARLVARGHLYYHSLLRPSQCRTRLTSNIKLFHTTPRLQWGSALMSDTHTILQNLHTTTELSWALTLPLSAFLVRLVIILPISLYTRRAQQKQLQLQPLIHAWRHQINRTIIRERGHLGPGHCTTEVKKSLRAKRRELYKRCACGWWRNWLPLGQLPVFLCWIETVRAMCGTKEGLLGMIVGSMASMKDSDTLEKADHTLRGNPEASIPVETTFATEGALWFPDLLVPDPHLLLPFILSATMFTNIWLNTRLLNAGTEQSVFQRGLMNSLKVIALMIGPATLQMPSAILVYWISSSSFAMLQNLLLDIIMPLGRPVKPCKPKNTVNAKLLKDAYSKTPVKKTGLKPRTN